jgi:hypothetical protein
MLSPLQPGVNCVALEVAILGRAASEITHDVRTIAELRNEVGNSVVAKVRCGGVNTGAVPTVVELAAFVQVVGECQLPFKATAGLHHPFAAATPSEANPWRHGFVNVLAASALALRGASSETLVAVLAETDPAAFSTNSWRDQPVSFADARRNGFIGMGTCSILEPVADLKAAGWL